MGKVVDITEKLTFDENPKIKIKGKEYEVNADAMTVLEIIGLLSGEKNDITGMVKSYDKLFSESARKDISKLKLPFEDLLVIIQDAMSLAIGGSEESGE